MHPPVVHPSAVIDPGVHLEDGCTIGALTRIEAGAVIGAGAAVDAQCLVGSDCMVAAGVSILAGARVMPRTTLEEGVLVGPNAVIGSSAAADGQAAPTLVRARAAVLANSVVDGGVTIGPRARVMPNAHVTRSVPANAVVAGVPAVIEAYVDAIPPGESAIRVSRVGAVRPLGVEGASLVPITVVEDLRGRLAAADFEAQVPFSVRRVFFVSDVLNRNVRGEHAHRELHQLLICLQGECSVVVDDGRARLEVILDSPGIGIHLAPLTWSVQYKHAPGTVLAVLASAAYDAADYIRDYDEFLQEKGSDR